MTRLLVVSFGLAALASAALLLVPDRAAAEAIRQLSELARAEQRTAAAAVAAAIPSAASRTRDLAARSTA